MTQDEIHPEDANNGCHAHRADATITEDMPVPDSTMEVFVLHAEAKFPIPYKVATDATPGKVTVAEARLQTMPLPIAPRSLVATHLKLDQPLHAEQYVLLHENLPESAKCPFLCTKYSNKQMTLNLGLPCSRLEALWRQQGWVAKDEMTYYLEATEYDDQGYPFPPAIFFNETDAKETAKEWLEIGIDVHATDKPWCSAAAVAAHWIPLIISHQGNVIQLMTTPEGTCLIEPASQIAHSMGKTIEVTQRILPEAFPGDCGFQAIAWLIANLNNFAVEAMSASRAAQWRHLFVRELCKRGTGYEIIHHLDIAGHKLDAQELRQLADLLAQHGVWPERAADRANALANAIPASSIRNVIASPRPWQDLKAAETHHAR